MMKRIYLLSLAIVFGFYLNAQDTFSICAIDTITGEVGSAGASCVYISGAGVRILSDVHPGIGVIHTQAYYLASNQLYARGLMDDGLSPQQIIDSLVENDAQNNPTKRQYGIVDFRGGEVRCAAYTGVNTDDYKNHIIGPNYTIQGNILLGQQILDSMESRFLNTEGDLACRLMAALQGAKVVGADTRCMADGISSIGSFIRVAQPDDEADDLFLDLNIPIADDGVDPIDSLQVLFEMWGGCEITGLQHIRKSKKLNVFPNPSSSEITFEFDKAPGNESSVLIWNSKGQQVYKFDNPSKTVQFKTGNLPSGIYFYQLIVNSSIQESGKIIIN